jgi:hypothetical protein
MHEPDCKAREGGECGCFNHYEWSDDYQRTLTPEVGMGATTGYGGDHYPVTIVKVERGGMVIWLAHDKLIKPGLYEPATPMSGDPRYWHKATRRRDGMYREEGSHGCRVTLGVRDWHRVKEF